MSTINFHDRDAEIYAKARHITCKDDKGLFLLDLSIEGIDMTFFRYSLEQLEVLDHAIHQAIEDLRKELNNG